MSDAPYSDARDALNGRYYRKLEMLYHCSRESFLPWKKIGAYLSNHPDRLNKGNSLRVMHSYLEEFALDNFGQFKEGMFIVSKRGKDLLQIENIRFRRYLKPIDWNEKK